MLKLMSSASQQNQVESDPLAAFVNLLINVDETPESVVDLKNNASLALVNGSLYDATGVPGIRFPNGSYVTFQEKPPVVNTDFLLNQYEPWSLEARITVPDPTKTFELFNQTQVGEWRAGTTRLFYENGYLWVGWVPAIRYYYYISARTPIALNAGINEISVERRNVNGVTQGDWEVYHNGVKLANMVRHDYNSPYDQIKDIPLLPVSGAFHVVSGYDAKLHNLRITRGAVRFNGQSYQPNESGFLL